MPKNNELAFPHVVRNEEDAVTAGMTLRDYFAAAAISAFIRVDGTHHFSERAKEAYEVADAMLKARDEEPSP